MPNSNIVIPLGDSKGMSKPRIYFAGKISKHGWRHSLVPFLDKGLTAGYPEDERNLFDSEFELDCGSFIYTGPFFVACDHGCGHGANRHGVGIDFTCGSPQSEDTTRPKVFAVNKKRLERSDLVFAYVESFDAYGTLIELGMANAWRKPVGLRLPAGPAISDLWMAGQAAENIYFGGTPKEAWGWFRQEFAHHFRAHRSFANYIGKLTTTDPTQAAADA